MSTRNYNSIVCPERDLPASSSETESLHQSKRLRRRYSKKALSTRSRLTDRESWKAEKQPLLTTTSENARLLGARTSLLTSFSDLTDEAKVEELEHEIYDTEWSWPRKLKVGILTLVLIASTVLLLVIPELNTDSSLITVSPFKPTVIEVDSKLDANNQLNKVIETTIRGSLVPENDLNFSRFRLKVDVVTHKSDGNTTVGGWSVGILPLEVANQLSGESITVKHHFLIQDADLENDNVSLVLTTNYPLPLPLVVTIQLLSDSVTYSLIYGTVVLVLMYVGIIFELAHRTVITMLAATGTIAILATLNERPTLEAIVTWIDIETVVLLFSMMVIVSVMSETGLFNYIGYWAFKSTKGRLWPLLTVLCGITAVVSAFLDNVTTILLMTPVVIKLCERINVDPVRILIATVIFSNIGGTATPVGDPPNVIIVNYAPIAASGINFASFTIHMLPCVLVVGMANFALLRFMYRKLEDNKEDTEIRDLRHEVIIWNRTAQSLSNFSKEESLVKEIVEIKVEELVNELEKKVEERRKFGRSFESWQDMEEDYSIEDKPLLIKSLSVLSVVVILFFLQIVPELKLSLGWTALLGAIAVVILQDKANLESILNRVEWTTLIFFATLFVVMEALDKLGLLASIGQLVADAIESIDKDSRLPVAILLILWVSGLASAFIDNIPFATMMAPIIYSLSEDLDLPLSPLVYSLALGCCLGGNGTLIGASANVVCAGVAEQHGYNFTFTKFFVIGFPVTLLSLVISSVYLLICHVWLEWN